MKKYEQYKDSEVEWIGEIPEDWTSVRLKWVSKISKGKKPKVEYEEASNGRLPYLSMEYLRGQTNSPTYADPEEESLLQVDEGDHLILWDGSKAGEIVTAKKGFLSSTMAKVGFEDDRFADAYLNYLLQIAQSHIQANTIGMGIPHVSGKVLKDVLMLIPTQSEQTKIVEYLNHQTGLIDAIIAKKHQLIEKLKEQRQAIINEAVTKGLDPNAQVKDSGVEWLGEIPEHWEVCKLKHIAELKSGNFISANDIEQQGEYPVYGGNGLRGYSTSFTHQGNFVLIGRQGALCGNINYAEGKFWATEHAVVVTVRKEMDVFYLGELLRTMNLNQYNESAAQPGLAVGKIENLWIPKISYEDQVQISNFINREVEIIGKLISKVEAQILKLKSYRQSIISEAVTGKIDVREWEPGIRETA